MQTWIVLWNLISLHHKQKKNSIVLHWSKIKLLMDSTTAEQKELNKPWSFSYDHSRAEKNKFPSSFILPHGTLTIAYSGAAVRSYEQE